MLRCLGAGVLLAGVTGRATAQAPSPRTYVFVKLDEVIQPADREARYERPLEAALREAGVGRVLGGVNSSTPEGAIEWVGLEVELTDYIRGIPLLRKKLAELGAPRGSTLEYRFNGRLVRLPVHDGS